MLVPSQHDTPDQAQRLSERQHIFQGIHARILSETRYNTQKTAPAQRWRSAYAGVG